MIPLGLRAGSEAEQQVAPGDEALTSLNLRPHYLPLLFSNIDLPFVVGMLQKYLQRVSPPRNR